MFVPMKKVSLIIRGVKKKETLKKLRKLGILHIDILEGKGEKLEELRGKISLLENAAFILEENKTKETKAKEASAPESLSMAEDVISLTKEKKDRLAEQSVLTAELDRFKSWGNIDTQSIKKYDEHMRIVGLDMKNGRTKG